MKTWIICLIFLCAVVSYSVASTIRQVTDYGTSSATLAVGDVYGVSPYAYAIFENPASLAKSQGIDVSAMFMTLADASSTYTNLATSLPFIKGRLGVGYAQAKSSGLDFTQEDRFSEFYSQSTFEISETLMKLGWQRDFSEHISYGAAVSYYEQDLLITKGTGINADIGILANYNPVLMSFAVSNLFSDSKVKYTDGYGELEFPMIYALGMKLRYTKNLTGYGQIKAIGQSGLLLKSFGAKYKIPYTGMAFLLGWREFAETNKVFNRFTTGLLMDLHLIRLSVSYEKTELESSSDAFTFSIDLNL